MSMTDAVTAAGKAVEDGVRVEWPDPLPGMLERADFWAVWRVVTTWDIAVPGAYEGYSGATGNHVRAILDALGEAPRQPGRTGA